MSDYITQSSLKERGWTGALIRRFLSTPDRTARNPHYRCAAPMKLYEVERVEAIENTPDFQAALAKARKRSESAQRSVETKRTRLLTYVRDLAIDVPLLSEAELTRAACDDYNRRNPFRLEFEVASEGSDPDFLDRIRVNYLRHRLTRYHEGLAAVFGKVGVNEAYVRLKKKVLRAIEEAYPWLADECDAQAREVEWQAECSALAD